MSFDNKGKVVELLQNIFIPRTEISSGSIGIILNVIEHDGFNYKYEILFGFNKTLLYSFEKTLFKII